MRPYADNPKLLGETYPGVLTADNHMVFDRQP